MFTVMFKKSLALMLGLSCFTLPVQAQSSASDTGSTGTIERYQRKYISFFYAQDYPLNRALSRKFEADFPRFDYHLASTAFNVPFADFLKQTRQYQAKNAGAIAAGKTQPNQRFGDKVVSWSETQKIAQSAYVFAPRWEFDEISLEGPFPRSSSNPNQDWYVSAVSDVTLNMGIYNLKGKRTGYDHMLRESWEVEREKAIRIKSSLIRRAAAAASTPSDPIDLNSTLSSSERERVLEQLLRNSAFAREARRVRAQNPTRYMMDAALDDVTMGRVINSVRNLSEFLIRAEISEPDMEKDRVEVTLGEGETSTTLGIRTDAGYKVIEYVSDGDSQSSREVGYIKVRQREDNLLVAQPIIVDRDFELGDQVVEYPKQGFGLNLRGGGAYSLDPERFGGELGLDLDVNLGPGFNLSETYIMLSGGAMLASNDFFGGLVELGIQKKWYMRQLILAATLKGGGLFEGGDNGDGAGGVTGLVGVHWQQNPDFGYGLNAGWRFYGNGAGVYWNGPVLETFIRFDG